jgi:protein ImuB
VPDSPAAIADRATAPLYACLFRLPVPVDAADQAAASAGSPRAPVNVLAAIAEQFSPRYELHGDSLVSIDVSGLERLLGPPRAVAEEIRREAASRGGRVHIAIAGRRIAALVLAMARAGVTVVAPGGEREALAPIHLGILGHVAGPDLETFVGVAASAFKQWGLKTLGELAALPPADLVARLGKPALALQAIARGDDQRPLVPTLEDERFEATQDLEWPIEELEPLSFVLTRLLEPLSTRLERRDRGAAVLHVLLRLVTRAAATDAGGETREIWARRLELPTPMRDVRTLRTLALVDLESHPPGAAVDRVTIVIDPTPGRVLQHTLFTRAHPTPEQLSTLVARLGALMGPDRFGAPALVDTYRPGAFAMTAFTTDHPQPSAMSPQPSAMSSQPSAINDDALTSTLRRCRHPVPARVAVDDGRPVRVTTDRRGFAGGAVVRCAGPWRTSGAWWQWDTDTDVRTDGPVVPVGPSHPDRRAHRSNDLSWDRDEWDVSLSDGAVYRVFRDRRTDGWYIDAIVD